MVKGTLTELSGLWVYIVTNSDTGETLYIGCERLRTIPTLRELKRHALGSLDNAQLNIELYSYTATPEQGEQLVATLNAVYNPRYAKGTLTPTNPVRCEQTGEVYANAHQAAKATGINYSHLYYHLAGLQGYKKCKGLTFTYIEA